jgi:hypothetical protein
VNDFPNNFDKRNLPVESDNASNTLTIAAAAVFAAAIIALVIYAPGNKEGSQVASNDSPSSAAITQPGPAFNKPAANRPATPAPSPAQ